MARATDFNPEDIVTWGLGVYAFKACNVLDIQADDFRLVMAAGTYVDEVPFEGFDGWLIDGSIPRVALPALKEA